MPIKDKHSFLFAVFIRQPLFEKQRSMIALVIITYGLVLGTILIPHLGDMTVPVVRLSACNLSNGPQCCFGDEQPSFYNNWCLSFYTF